MCVYVNVCVCTYLCDMRHEEIKQPCSLIILGCVGNFVVLEGLKHFASRMSLLVPKRV